MITIKNYDSSRELSNYQIGDVYTFYIHNPNMKRLVNVKETDFEPYVEKLNNIIDTHEDVIMNNVPYLNFTRSIGVVIDTHESTSSHEHDYITVMFRTELNEFVINKLYAPTLECQCLCLKNVFQSSSTINSGW